MADSSGVGSSRRRDIGRALGRARHRARQTERDAAAHLDCAPRIAAIEEGTATARVGEVEALLDLYAVAGSHREEILTQARGARDRCWWHPYGDMINESFETQLILEDEARLVRTYQPNLVPGLLQTQRYATELIETQSDLPLEQVHQQASLRAERQQVLTRPSAPHLSVIIDEAVLWRPVGGHAVMREQYAFLAKVASTPRMTIKVLPFQAGPHHVLGLGFHIFSFGTAEQPVVELELLDRVRFVAESREVAHYERAFESASSQALDVQDSKLLLARFAAAA